VRETRRNYKVQEYLLQQFTHAVVYKNHGNAFAKGRPDSTFVWGGYTSWLEFKLLEPTESIHDQLDPLQLVELVKLERACARSWVVAFRKPKKGDVGSIEIYQPHRLRGNAVPASPVLEPTEYKNALRDLRTYGIISRPEFDYRLLAELLLQTHAHKVQP
jgi:hypothetical protein